MFQSVLDLPYEERETKKNEERWWNDIWKLAEGNREYILRNSTVDRRLFTNTLMRKTKTFKEEEEERK